MFKRAAVFILVSQILICGTILGQSNKKNYRKNRQINAAKVVTKTKDVVITPTPTPMPTQNPVVSPTVLPTPQLIISSKSTSSSFDDIKNPERIVEDKNESLGNDVQGGNVVVKITSNGNASVKIGLANRGVTVVEFPYSDPVYKIFPGDENYVTIDCGARDKENRCLNSPTDSIVLRPGKLFSQWVSEEDSATVITVQRVSGIVVSFIVLPVRSISQHAFHVVVRYDLAEVIAQRRSAGLPFNLNRSIENRNEQSDKNIPSGIVYDANNQNDSKNSVEKPLGNIENAVYQNSDIQTVQDSSEADLELRTVDELKRVAKSQKRLYFTKPHHGISIAVGTEDPRTSDYVIEVIAIRNMTNKAIRLVPDQPELFLDLANPKEKNESVTSERLSIVIQASTADENDVLLPNTVYYFAFAYKMPILGAKQVLKVGFASREAADEPATVILLGLLRR